MDMMGTKKPESGRERRKPEGPVIAEAPAWNPEVKAVEKPQPPSEEVVQQSTTRLDPLIRATLNVAGDFYPELWEALTPVGHRNFVTQLVEAAMLDNEAGDGDRVARVVAAWYRTMILRMDPDYEQNLERTRQEIRQPEGETVEELRRRLG